MQSNYILDDNPWLKTFNCHVNRQPVLLFCFHHAGGTASMYKNWQKGLAECAEVIAVQLPGRENRFKEPLLEHSDVLINLVADAIADSLDDRPYVFFGHSLGASLGLHVIHELLRRKIRAPIGLIVSARNPFFCNTKNINPTYYTDLEFLDMLLMFGGIPNEIINEYQIINSFLPRLRSDFYLSYRLQMRQVNLKKLNIPILALGGIADPTLSSNEIDGWSTYTTNNFRAILLPGDHFFIRNEFMLFRIIIQTIRNFNK